MPVKIGFAKLGSIGSAALIEFLLDERAEREDIDVRVVGSGAKIGVAQAEEVGRTLLALNPALVVVTTPNAALPGPSRLRELLKEAGVATIVVSDAPAKKVAEKIEADGQGYVIVLADSMIGARREFLDPVEMALFNADIIKVLAITGVYRLLQREIDAAIEALKQGKQPELPRLVVDKSLALASAGLQNPYAQARALAAYEVARRVADITVEGCFIEKEWERYTRLVAAGHEAMRAAAQLAEEARELEKAGDTVYRTPHYDDGTIMEKSRLIEKPSAKG